MCGLTRPERVLHMKKITALLLAMMMVLSLATVSLGEAAEYSNFMEHYKAFLNGLDLQKNDVYFVGQMQDETYHLLIGANDEGTVNVMAAKGDEAPYTLQLDDSNIYLNFNGSTMAVSMETISSFISNLPQRVLGYLKMMGIDPDQIMADIQTLAGLAYQALAKVMPAVEQTTEGSVVTIKLNSEAFANGMAEAIDGLLANENFNEIVSRYAAMFGAQFSPDAWPQAREQVIALLSQLQYEMVLNMETGDYTMKAGLDMGEALGFAMDLSGKAGADGMTMNGSMTVKNGENSIREDINCEAQTGYGLPKLVRAHIDLYQNDQAVASMDEEISMDPFKALFSMSMQGQEAIRIEYHDLTADVLVMGTEIMHAELKADGVEIRITNPQDGQQMNLSAKLTENSADRMVVEEKIEIGGQTRTGYIVYEILEDNGVEYLNVTGTVEDQTIMIYQIQQTEKQAFAALKDDENVNWVTEDQLNQLFDQAFSTLVSRLMPSTSSY